MRRGKLKYSNLILLYSIFLCILLVLNAVDFWNEKEPMLSIVSGLFLFLLLLFMIGYYRGKNSFIWLGVICFSIYSIYVIIALFWVLFTQGINLFFIIVAVTLLSINIFIILHLKNKLSSKP